MIRMTGRLPRWEQKRLRKMTEEAKQRGDVTASLFLEGEMNALADADCFFFYGSRWRPKGLLTVFFPDEEHAEITAAEFIRGREVLPLLYASALRECRRAGIEQIHTVRNPACGFDLTKIDGFRFTYEWSEYLLCKEMRLLGEVEACSGDTAELWREVAPEQDGTLRYVFLQNGQETAECRLLPTDNGKQCYLFGLKTKEAFRRKGMATTLLRRIAEEYKEQDGAVLRLQVSSKNEPAERLYRKLGFLTEEQREYYKTEEC